MFVLFFLFQEALNKKIQERNNKSGGGVVSKPTQQPPPPTSQMPQSNQSKLIDFLIHTSIRLIKKKYRMPLTSLE